MSSQRFPAEFKDEAVRQIIERGYSVAEVAERLGVSTNSRASEIIGQPLSGVAFVQDYVELHFDGKILRTLANPSIAGDRGRFAFPEAGSRCRRWCASAVAWLAVA